MKSCKIRRLEFISDKLREGIARGRSCASVLIVPQRKMTLVRVLHGRRSWPELELQGRHHGGAQRRGEIGGRSGAGGCDCWGGGARGRAGCRRESWWLLLCLCCSCALVVREKKLVVREKKVGGRRREEKREKRKEEGKEKKKRKNGKISKLGNF
jgi:hypothetical protein